jgi:hypothetical protein
MLVDHKKAILQSTGVLRKKNAKLKLHFWACVLQKRKDLRCVARKATLIITTSPVTIENIPDRDFTSEQVANKLPTTSVLFNVGIVEILSCNSL